MDSALVRCMAEYSSAAYKSCNQLITAFVDYVQKAKSEVADSPSRSRLASTKELSPASAMLPHAAAVKSKLATVCLQFCSMHACSPYSILLLTNTVLVSAPTSGLPHSRTFEFSNL